MKYGKRYPGIPVVALLSLLFIVGIIYLSPITYVWGQSSLENELLKTEAAESGPVSLEEKIEEAKAAVESSKSDYIDWLTAPASHKIRIDEEQIYLSRLSAYRNIAEQCILQYGEPGAETDGDLFLCKGLSFLKLVDFDKDGYDELLLVFCVMPDEASGNGGAFWEGSTFIFNVWGYESGKPVLLQDGQNLYATNGGIQSVLLVDNKFGIFLKKGGADLFEYNYFYGYTDSGFGLAKNFMYEWVESGDHWIDGEQVSEERWKREIEEWDVHWGDEEHSECYILRGYGSGDMYKSLNQTNETLAFLRK